MKYRIICPDNDEIVARPRTRETALVALRTARRKHKAELYELVQLRGWIQVQVPDAGEETVRP